MGFDAPAYGAHLGQDHVQANAPAGQFGNLVCRRKARDKQQLSGFIVAERLVWGQQTGRHCTGANLVDLQARAVVCKGDGDIASVLLHGNGQGAQRRLARRQAHLYRFNAVGHCVAQKVLKGGRHAFEHAPVDFDAAAHDVQAHLLARAFGRLANHCIKPVGQGLKIEQPHAQQIVRQLLGAPPLGEQVF